MPEDSENQNRIPLKQNHKIMRNKDEYLQNQLTQKISKENWVFPFLIDNTFQVSLEIN